MIKSLPRPGQRFRKRFRAEEIKMSISGTIRLNASAFVLAMALLQPAVAHAQTADAKPADPKAAAADNGEATDAAIIVTGTSIRGAPPVGSSLIQVGRQDIDASPSVTTTQLVREVPQIFNFGVTDSARNQSGGAGNIVYGNSINIRGIGPFATLTLIDGRRAIGQGTLGASVDPSSIPAISLERIEVIADGASAIYGSDAVAGVANLILRRNYKGLGADVQYGFADNYNEFTANAIVGANWGSGHFTLGGQHAYRTALSGLDRAFYKSDLTAFGGADYRTSGLCNPGTVSIANAGVTTTYAIPASGATAANLVAGAPNKCDNIKTTDILPQQEMNSAVLTFDQDLTEGVHFFTTAMYARRDAFRRSAVATSTLAVPTTNPFFVSPTGATLPNCAASVGVATGTKCENVQYSFAGLYGQNATAAITSESYQVTGGFDVKISDKWNFNTYLTAGFDHDHVFSVGGGVDAANLASALRSTDPTTALNPFGTAGGNSAATLASVFDRLTDTDGKSKLTDWGAKIDGTLFSLPGGDVKVAVGGEYNKLWIRTGQIVGRKGAQTGTDQILERSVKSGYVEVLMPIVGEGNAMPGVKSLTLDIAGRIDKYSDVGKTTNPKFGLTWEVVDDFKIHASYGESFRAPLLTNIVSASGSQLFLQNYFDPTANGGAGATIQGVAMSGGNLNLKPETARTWSLGVDYNPAWLPGSQFSVNYFNVTYDGQIVSYLSNLNVLRQESLFSSIILRGAAAQARIAQEVAAGKSLNGGTQAQILASPVFVDGHTQNLGLTKTQGIDFGLSVPFDVGGGSSLRASLRGARFFNYKVALTPGGAILDQINNIDFPLKFRARASLQYQHGPLNVNVFANYTNGYNNTFSTLKPKIAANTTIDLTAAYDFGEMFGLTKRFQLGLNVTNLFDKAPPFADLAPTNNGGGGFDPTVSSPIGRIVSVSLRTKF